MMPPWTMNLFFHDSNSEFFFQYLELEDKINKFLGNFWYCDSWHDELILGIFHSIALILKSTRQNLFDQFRLLFKKIFKKKKSMTIRVCLRLLQTEEYYVMLVVNKQRLNNRKIRKRKLAFLSVDIYRRKKTLRRTLSSRIMNRFIAKRHIWWEIGRDEMMNYIDRIYMELLFSLFFFPSQRKQGFKTRMSSVELQRQASMQLEPFITLIASSVETAKWFLRSELICLELQWWSFIIVFFFLSPFKIFFNISFHHSMIEVTLMIPFQETEHM